METQNQARWNGGISLSPSFFNEFVKRHQLSCEAFTEQQMAEAIRQMIVSGDFVRYVLADGSGQSVSYEPGRGTDELRGKYDELVMAVVSKHEGETRHETALRYIQERESAVLDEGGRACDS